MRTPVITAALAVTTAMALAGCGKSSDKTASAATIPFAPATASTGAPAPSSSSGKPTFTGQSVCDSLPDSGVRGVLTNGAGPGTPSEPQDGVHACSWKATDGKSALVVLLIDNGDQTHVDSLDVPNSAAGTDFSGVAYSSKDVGVRDVRASYLTDADVHTTPPGLDDAAATVRDVFYKRVFG